MYIPVNSSFVREYQDERGITASFDIIDYVQWLELKVLESRNAYSSLHDAHAETEKMLEIFVRNYESLSQDMAQRYPPTIYDAKPPS